jgi:membrane protein
MARKPPEDASAPPGFLVRLKNRITGHHVPIFAAAIAFFGFVALVPALVATVSITSLVADPDDLISEAESALEAAPDETREFLVSQLDSIAASEGSGVGIAAVVGVALAVFSASGAIGNLMAALNVVFDREEARNFLAKRLLAISLLLGAIILLGAMVVTMTIIPAQLENWVDSGALRGLINVARFVGLGLLMAFGLTVLYRVGPTSVVNASIELLPGGKRDSISIGAIVGTVLFVALSWGFGVFVRNFGSYNETYGALAGIIVVLLWLQLSALAILIGAEIDALRAEIRVEQARRQAGLPALTS